MIKTVLKIVGFVLLGLYALVIGVVSLADLSRDYINFCFEYVSEAGHIVLLEQNKCKEGASIFRAEIVKR